MLPANTYSPVIFVLILPERDVEAQRELPMPVAFAPCVK
jgi:hypothetical protein